MLPVARGFDDLGEAARVEAGAANESAVDVGLTHEFAGILWFDAAAVRASRCANCYSDGHPRCDAETHAHPPAASDALAPADSAAAVKRRNPVPCSKTNAGDSAPRRKTSVKAAVPAGKRRTSQATCPPLRLQGRDKQMPGVKPKHFGGQEP